LSTKTQSSLLNIIKRSMTIMSRIGLDLMFLVIKFNLISTGRRVSMKTVVKHFWNRLKWIRKKVKSIKCGKIHFLLRIISFSKMKKRILKSLKKFLTLTSSWRTIKILKKVQLFHKIFHLRKTLIKTHFWEVQTSHYPNKISDISRLIKVKTEHKKV
jgi:hypothetical protein